MKIVNNDFNLSLKRMLSDVIHQLPINMFKRVIMAISGGVDSAVSAHLLRKHPNKYDVVAVFMKNWDEIDEFGKCTGEADWEDAQYVCQKLNIPIHQVNFVKQYWNEVFENFLQDYQNGITPNPDILCNRHIKFNIFFNFAMKRFNADAFATGHYAQSSFGQFLERYDSEKPVKLLQAVDEFKDQTFFLSQVSQEALRRTMFPVGNLLKAEVKGIAHNLGLKKILDKRESVGVCFVGRRNFQDFISEYIDEQEGDFIDIDSGEIVGKHKGIHTWTVGQRCHLGGFSKPYFVQSKDKSRNNIFVAFGTDHLALFSNSLYTSEPTWIHEPKELAETSLLDCRFRFQHTKPLVDCLIYRMSNQKLYVKLHRPLRAITPGQYAVFYKDNECLGSARIISPGPSMMYESDSLNEQLQEQESIRRLKRKQSS